ncbi:mahogunin [Anaeramoeba flamelloides]|uniref:Mahogunin n=1 Tax=Anaeramoeba flamelloides TaxID=1746091 RepID=A0ABQ8YP45_9EUKA|nr:mahogunin [Anaeramoeba flamelloides]
MGNRRGRLNNRNNFTNSDVNERSSNQRRRSNHTGGIYYGGTILQYENNLDTLRPEIAQLLGLEVPKDKPKVVPKIQKTKTLQNNINLQKDSLRIIPLYKDKMYGNKRSNLNEELKFGLGSGSGSGMEFENENQKSPTSFKLSFKFDTNVPVIIRVFWCANEFLRKDNSIYFKSEIDHPSNGKRFKFEKGISQTFNQSDEYSIDISEHLKNHCEYIFYKSPKQLRKELMLKKKQEQEALLRLENKKKKKKKWKKNKKKNNKNLNNNITDKTNNLKLKKKSMYEIFPILIAIEANLGTIEKNNPYVLTNSQSQRTFATFVYDKVKKTFSVRVLKQKITINQKTYLLKEIYGLDNDLESKKEKKQDSTLSRIKKNERSKECVICLDAESDTTILPCRHCCMCHNCAKILSTRSNICPLCRGPMKSFIQIQKNVNTN